MSDPSPPSLPPPSSAPRLTKSGRQERDRPIYSQSGGVGFRRWEVEVTPLVGTTHIGRGLDSGRVKPRAVFEVRALYYGPGLAAFGRQPNTRVSPRTHTEDQELALAIAREFESRLRRGVREIDLVELTAAVEARR